MGLFFLPTLLVWSFTGCGGALLTGGLKQVSGKEERNPSLGAFTGLLSPALQRQMSLTHLHKNEPNLCFSLDSTLLILISSKAERWKENIRTSIHFSFNFFGVCFINVTNIIAQEHIDDKNIQMLVLHTQKLLHGVHYQQSLDYCSKVSYLSIFHMAGTQYILLEFWKYLYKLSILLAT